MPASRLFASLAPLALLCAGLGASSAVAAETVHLTLSANGDVIPGDSLQTNLGRANTIECVLFRTGVRAPTGEARLEERRVTLTCRKRLDKASPRLLTALAQQASLEVVARYYRLNPTGDGTIEQYYTLTAHNGRITAIKQLTPDALQAPSAPDLEEVTFEFASMSHAYISGGVEGAFP